MAAVKTKYRGTTTYRRVHAELVRAAQNRGTTTYQEIAVVMGLPIRGAHMAAETSQILGEISEDEVGAGRPMLSAVAVNVHGKPGSSFFPLAKKLERVHAGEAEDAFWHREVIAVYEAWR